MVQAGYQQRKNQALAAKEALSDVFQSEVLAASEAIESEEVELPLTNQAFRKTLRDRFSAFQEIKPKLMDKFSLSI